MPSRVTREGILTSYRVNQLDAPEEVFYRRLQSVVDDFGRFSANPAQLRAACYPVCLDKYSEVQIKGFLESCINADLIDTYEVNGHSFLEYLRFQQRTRIMKPKWPLRNTENLEIYEGPKGGKCYKIKRLTDDGQMTVTFDSGSNADKMTVIRPSDDRLIQIQTQIQTPIQTPKGEGCRSNDRQMTDIPVFEPVKLGMYPREYDALIANALAQVKAIRAKPESYVKDLSQAAEELIAYLETEKPESFHDRIEATYNNPDSYERKNLKPKPAQIVDAWKSRITELQRAKAGIKN